jgi:hypothetical protein
VTFILEEALLFHLKTEHAQKIDTLNCADCSLEFFSKGTKAIHDTIQHNASNNQLYSCKFCLEAATSISEIIQHHKDYHEIQAMPFFQCENCDFVSEKISETRSHSKSVHGIDDYRSVYLRMKFWCLEIFQKVNLFFDRFLP